jgi:hypothetical protein
VPAIDIERRWLFTPTIALCGAMRGFGRTQSAFAIENCSIAWPESRHRRVGDSLAEHPAIRAIASRPAEAG